MGQTIRSLWTTPIFSDCCMIDLTADGGYVLAGGSESDDGVAGGNQGFSDFWVVSLSPEGDLVWRKTFGGSGDYSARAVRPTPDGGLIVIGDSYFGDGDVTGHHGLSDFWVVKLSADGSLRWQKCLGGSGHDLARDIWVASDGGYLVAGSSESDDGDVGNNNGGEDWWVVKLGEDGSIVWRMSEGGSQDDEAASIRESPDGSLFGAGSVQLDDEGAIRHGEEDCGVVKLAP